MSSLKSTVDRLKVLEAEKLNLIAQVEDLKKMAEARANSLETEIAALRAELSSLNFLRNENAPLQADAPKIEKQASSKESVEKFLTDLDRIGNKVFTAPFSQNFDSWIGEVQQVVSHFETSQGNLVDEQFRKDYTQVLQNIQCVLNSKKAEEANAGEVTAALAESNRLLAETEIEYAEKERELTLKGDSETQRLTQYIHELEGEVEKQEKENAKRKLLKKKTDDKIPQAVLDLKAAKNRLEKVQQESASEREELKATNEGRKQEIISQIEDLREKMRDLETDASLQSRQEACKALANMVNALVKRNTSVALT